MNQVKTYAGKNAWWLILVIGLYNVCPIIIFYNNLDILNIWWIILGVFYYGFNLVWIPILIRNKIELYDNYFILYYGFQKERININDIIQIEKSHNPIAATANSIDRIYIKTNNRELYISLKDNDNFIKEILNKKMLLLKK